MESYLTILILFVSAFSANAQEQGEVESIQATLSQSHFKTVEADLNELLNTFPDDIQKDEFKFYRNDLFYLNLGFDLSIYDLQFYKTISFNNGLWNREEYNLKIIFTNQDSTVLFAHFYKSVPNGISLDIVNSCDSLTLQNKLSVHDSVYSTKTVFDCKDVPFLKNSYYSPLCPRHGSDKYDQMIEYVNQENIIELEKLLKQFDPADKVYGYKGLYFIRKNGIELSEGQNLLMSYTKNIAATIQTDVGIRLLMSLIYYKGLDREFAKLIENGKIKRK